jgi:hypothetical protein
MTPSSFAERICYYYPYVAPATILSAEPVDNEDPSSLRADASCNDACFFEITRSYHDGTFLARVAAHPGLIRTQGYTVVLNAAQLAQARPFVCRVSGQAA